jgi:catechol 2,3-dioxygenase-like lactoylglutathione lyase family enzyme
MFDHVEIRVSDGEASKAFYATVLPVLGIAQSDDPESLGEWGEFSLWPAEETRPVTRGLHIGFVAPSRDHVDEFWRVGTEAGYRDDGAPGLRPQYSDDYYGAFLLDPDGNSVEAVRLGDMTNRDVIDHLWLRVADVAAAKRFYETIAPYAGLRLGKDIPERVQFRGRKSTFSLVSGLRPTENVHMAFPAADNATVDEFHSAAIGAGYRDNGAPGERPDYHPGYYGAFVLDPDGNNIEVVNHNRG